MSFRIRAAREGDLDHLYEMAKLTGGGFTNLPADRRALKARLDKSSAAYVARYARLKRVSTGELARSPIAGSSSVARPWYHRRASNTNATAIPTNTRTKHSLFSAI